MTGHVRRRGARSGELKFDVGVDANGNRKIRYASFKGTKRDAQIELAKLIAAAAAGTLPDPSKTTVGEYLLKWIDGHRGLSGKTAERYRQLIVSQIIPHLGAIVLQKLKPAQIADWHDKLAATRKVSRHRIGRLAMRTGSCIRRSPTPPPSSWCRATWPASSNRRRSRKRRSKA